jgi:hypothetical protein
MTDRPGEVITTTVSISYGTQGAVGGLMICVAYPGSQVNPRPNYLLACFDSTNTRHFWVDYTISTTNAPALGGGATYTTSTLVVIGRF